MPVSTDINPAVLDRTAAARRIGVGQTTLAQLTTSGEIRSLQIGRRRLYRLQDLDDFVNSLVGRDEITGAAK